jgi:hypothetical protein
MSLFAFVNAMLQNSVRTWPLNSKALLLIWLWNNVEVHVLHHLLV